jgi:hypothetical protein
MLPLATLSALVLLLGSVSLLAMALQIRLRLAVEQQLLQEEDQIHNAAEELVARIQLRHRCLLPLPQSSWAMAACIAPDELQTLGHGELDEHRWQLVRWEPSQRAPTTADIRLMDLQLELRPAATKPPLRAAFLLELGGAPLRVQGLRLLGWSGRV